MFACCCGHHLWRKFLWPLGQTCVLAADSILASVLATAASWRPNSSRRDWGTIFGATELGFESRSPDWLRRTVLCGVSQRLVESFCGRYCKNSISIFGELVIESRCGIFTTLFCVNFGVIF